MLILGGISGAGMIALMQQYRPLFMAVTFGFLAIAFYLTYRPRRGGSVAAAKLMTVNKVMLWAVTVVAVGFLFFQPVAGLFATDDPFTEDMRRTVIRVEGMT